MDFRLGAEIDALRAEVAAFCEEHVTTALLEETERTGTYHDLAFAKALGARGWVAPEWPVEEGGAGMNPLEHATLGAELRRYQAPMDGVGTMMLVANTIRMWGTPEQKEMILGPAARGEIMISLGYSEADSGSDVAAARTRAVRDGDDWVIDGEKMFTTLAHVADYVFLLTRSNTEVSKHKGLTMFLIPMDTPGISIGEVRTLGGERTNITSYQDVRVPDSCRVGEVDGGWAVVASALDLEHSAGYAAEIERLVDIAAAEAALRPGVDGTRLVDDPLVLTRLAQAAIDAEVSRLLQLRAGWMFNTGRKPVAEGPMGKLFSSEAFTKACREVLDVFGPDGLTRERGLESTGVGTLEQAYRHSQVTRIYAGTSEIQRSLIAERGLGLPRTRMAAK
jgi:alkylation response protein AidB-like acyl-CoA dehydrogenase